ncbi:hypothetical protein K470DRAFT_192081, partial [Piedraia hortae CBS 480.64]
LKLPLLPRFHPANFALAQDQSSGNQSGVAPAPVSPRALQRLRSEAQSKVVAYQNNLLSPACITASGQTNPLSPRLQPLGSPGPVTPLELESDGYLVAGSKTRSLHS